MGRQLRFFQTEEDDIEFLNKVIEFGYLLIDKNGHPVTISEIINLNKYQVYIILDDSKLIIDGDYLDDNRSEVIEYSRCFKKGINIDYGRLWVQIHYYDLSWEMATKRKEVEDMYKTLVKWIKKNYLISVDKSEYIAKEAYKQYKEGNLICMATPNTTVRFD